MRLFSFSSKKSAFRHQVIGLLKNTAYTQVMKNLQGRFEILSLTGSYTTSENGGIKGRTGGLSVSLAGPDGRVIGGGVAGLLMAASPIQVLFITDQNLVLF